MAWHNFKYTLKALFRNKGLVFWTFAFPIILGTFFYLAFSNIESSETLKVIDIAIVDDEDFQKNTIYKEVFNVLGSSDNDTKLFNITYVSQTEAKSLLENKKITGYLNIKDEDIKITVASSGVNETILRYAIDEIETNTQMVKSIGEKEVLEQIKAGNFNIDYEKIYTSVAASLNNIDIGIKDKSSSNLSYTMIEYYTLIAMAAMYGGAVAMNAINYKLANMNSVGKRTSVSPIKKGPMILGSLIASYVVQVTGMILLFAYMLLVMKVDFGAKFIYIVILALAGVLAGLSMGVAIGTLIKTTEMAKSGILIAITMFGCFLSGMMGITMKYIIDKNVPILNKINPASMITDGFYSLYYYDTLDRFLSDIIGLCIFSAICIVISISGLRRQKYDSI